MTGLKWDDTIYDDFENTVPMNKVGDLMVMQNGNEYYICRADRGAFLVAGSVADAVVAVSAMSVLMYLSEDEFKDDDALQALLRQAERAGEARLAKWIRIHKENQGEA